MSATFSLSEESMKEVINENLIQAIKQSPRGIERLTIAQLKSLIRLHNAGRGGPRVLISGKKDELVERVSTFLFLNTQPIFRPSLAHFVTGAQKRTLEDPMLPAPKRFVHNANSLVASWEDNWEYDKKEFYLHQSPFWEEKNILHIIPLLGQPSMPTKKTSTFSLTNEQLRHLRNGENQIHIRLYNRLKRTDHVLGEEADLCINGRIVKILQKKTRTAPAKGQEPFIIPAPPIIQANILKQNNNFSFLSLPSSEFSGFLVVQLVQSISIQMLVKKVLVMDSSATTKKEDDDIAELSLKVGIRCPLSFSRIELPVRGINCSHVQCFDYESFLEYCRDSCVWYCPICYKTLPPYEVRRDLYFETILAHVGDDDSDDDTKVEINDDGSFQKSSLCAIPDTPPPSPPRTIASTTSQPSSLRTSNNMTQSTSSFICLLDSDEDEEEITSSVAVIPQIPQIISQPKPRPDPKFQISTICLSDEESDNLPTFSYAPRSFIASSPDERSDEFSE